MTPAVAQPDIAGTLQGAIRDSWPIMRSRSTVWIVFAVIAALAGIVIPFVPVSDAATGQGMRMQLGIQPPNLLGGIAAFFVIPAVLRTVRPDFRMTFGRVLGLIGVAIVVGVVTEVAAAFLIVPGVWVGVKWSQSYWTYLLGEGKNPFGESWEMTTYHFWETLGFLFLVAIVSGIVVIAAAIPVGVAVLAPILAVILLPIAFLVYVYSMHIAYLATMRWMLELRRIAGSGEAIVAQSG